MKLDYHYCIVNIPNIRGTKLAKKVYLETRRRQNNYKLHTQHLQTNKLLTDYNPTLIAASGDGLKSVWWILLWRWLKVNLHICGQQLARVLDHNCRFLHKRINSVVKISIKQHCPMISTWITCCVSLICFHGIGVITYRIMVFSLTLLMQTNDK